MAFRQLFDPESSTYTYLIADDATHEAVLIDPVMEQASRDLALLRELGLSLRWTLETHVHADHVTGALAIRQATNAQTAVSRDCNAQGYDRLLTDGDVVLFGHQEIMVIATPGHTPGSVSFLWRDRLFTGDTLLIGGCGRTDFQGGSAQALYHSITARLFTLDEQVLVYPGHDYKGRRVSSIGEEKQFNARIAGKSEAEFVHTMDTLNLPMPKKIHEAVPANLAGGGAAALQESFSTAAAASIVHNISARQLAAEWPANQGKARLIDVRTPAEFETVRVAGAMNVPLDRLVAANLMTVVPVEETIYCICQTGTRSQFAAERLRAAGFRHVVHVDGGTNAWQADGLPVVRGERKAISMERQVRIAAGSLTLLGVAAGALVHPAGYALAAFIGAGLFYSGASDTCTMALVLAKMPWNQSASPTA